MSCRRMLGPLVAVLLVTLAMGGCAGLNQSRVDDPQLAVLLIQLDGSDHRAAPASTLQRSWISTQLVPPGQPLGQAHTPVELHVSLRREGAHPEQLSHDHVLPLDGSQFMLEVDQTRAQPITVRVDRPGGSFVFSGGKVGEQHGRAVYGGPVVIRFQPGFREAAALLEGSVTTLDLMRASLLGLDQADLRRYAAAHVALTLSNAIELTQQKITPSDVQLLEEAGYRLAAAQLLAMRAGGVSVSDAVAFRRCGFQFNVQELIRLSKAGLTPAYALAMKSAGFGPDAQHLIELHAARIAPEYAARLRELVPGLTHAQLRQLAEAGIDPEALATLHKAGYRPSIGQMIRLHQSEVSPSDALLLRTAGYDFTLNELVTLAWKKVPTAFTISLLQDGFEPLSAEQIVTLYQRKVTPSMVRLLRQQNQEAFARTGNGLEVSGTQPTAGSDKQGKTDRDALIEVLGDSLSNP